MYQSEIRGAVARGWTHSTTEHLEMDSYLAEAISQEVEELINKKGARIYLGFATTKQLIAELAARMNIDLDYRTVDKDRVIVNG